MKSPVQPTGAYFALADVLNLRRSALGVDDAVVSKRFTLAGETAQSRLGHGMEYAEVRPYAANDDARHIDWRVTARKNTPHIKLYHEQFDAPVYFIVDQTTSLFFGSQVCFKSVMAAALATWFMWKAHALGHPVACSLCRVDGLQAVRAHKKESHIMQLCSQLVQANNALRAAANTTTPSFEQALNTVAKNTRQYGTVFIISDFWHWNKTMEQTLANMATMTQIRLCFIFDALEKLLPAYGTLHLTDLQITTTVNAASRQDRHAWHKAFAERLQAVQRFSEQHAVQLQLFATHQPIGS